MNSDDFEKKYVKNGKILPNNIDIIDGSLHLAGLDINKIENLPKKINGYLELSNNQIKKIENLPEIRSSLLLRNNEIKKIENLQKKIQGSLNLSSNNISKIENLPESIGGDLDIEGNHIKVIENLPKKVFNNIYLSIGIKDIKPSNSKFENIFFNNEEYTLKEYNDYVRVKTKKRNLKKFKDIL